MMETNILENNKFSLPGTKYNLHIASEYICPEIKMDFYVLFYFDTTLIYLYPQVFHFTFHLDNTQHLQDQLPWQKVKLNTF